MEKPIINSISLFLVKVNKGLAYDIDCSCDLNYIERFAKFKLSIHSGWRLLWVLAHHNPFESANF